METKQGFIKNTIKFKDYVLTATKFGLKSQLANSYIGYLWWILEPLFFMLIYVVVVTVIFTRSYPHPDVFILSGLMPWRWYSNSLNASTRSIINRINLIEQVYVPKYLLPQIDLLISGFEFVVSLPLLFIIMAISGIPVTWHGFEMLPVLISMGVFMYGAMLVLAHVGVYFSDIKNIVGLVLRFMFYLSPIMYDVSTLPPEYQWIWWFNPMTAFSEGFRNIFYYGKSPDYLILLVWMVVGIILTIIGAHLLDKFDKNYAKIK